MPRLRVLAGPSPDSLVPISNLVNTNNPHTISSEHFEGQVVVNIKGFADSTGKIIDSEYFHRPERNGITWSLQVQGRFLEHYLADDILFGNTFDRPLHLPWGSGAALKFMNYIDPSLEHDLGSSTQPWALSPLVSTMPHLAHKHMHRGSRSLSRTSSRTSSRAPSPSPGPGENEQSTSFQRVKHQQTLSVPGSEDGLSTHFFPEFPPKISLEDDLSQIHLVHLRNSDEDSYSSSSSSLFSSASSSSSSVSLHDQVKSRSSSPTAAAAKKMVVAAKTKIKKTKRENGPHLGNAQERQAFFRSARHRKEISFGPHDILTMDFCYGFLEFNPSLALRLPGGISFDLMRYWDGQPVRFVCCERGAGKEQPWGRMFWCVQIEIDGSEDDYGCG